MATDIETIGIAVDSRGVVKGTKDLDKFGQSADKASKKADQLTKVYDRQGRVITESSIRQAKAHEDNARAMRNSEKASSGLITGLKGLAAAYITLNSARALIGAIDNYTKFNAQLKLATRSQDEYSAALGDVSRIANLAQVSIGGIGVLYARLNNALRDLGVTQEKVSSITETVGLALKVSGATAQEASSAMIQLSQSFGSGVLRGEEFNAVNEAAPALMRALAESMGVPIGQLRSLAHEGEVTSEVMVKAFGDPKLLEAFRNQATEVGTISGAWQAVKNNILLAVGAADKYLGLSGEIREKLGNAAELFAPKTKGQKLYDIQQEIFALDRKGAAGSAYGKKYINTERARLEAEFKALSASGNISTVKGYSDKVYAPNFSNGVQAQDINKIHQAQEEADRKRLDNQKKYADKAKEQYEDKLKALQEELDEELETSDTINKYKAEQAEKLADLQEKLDKEELKRQEKIMDMLQDQANANFKEAQDTYKKAYEEQQKEFEKTVDGINETFREGFAQLVNGGKGSWKSFTQSLYTTFKTTVADAIYKLLAQPFVVRLVASILGVGASGSASAGGAMNALTGTGQNSLLGSIRDLSSNIQGGLTGSIEKLGTFFATGNGGFGDAIGGFLGQNAGTIANYMPYAGAFIQAISGDLKGAAFTAAGAAIGSIIPGVGTAIGAVVGSLVGGLFGGDKLPPRYYAGSATSHSGGVYTSAAEFKHKSAGGHDSFTQLNQAFIKTLIPIFEAYGLSTDIKVRSAASKKLSADAGLDFEFGNTGPVGIRTGKIKGGTIQGAFDQLLDKALGEGIVTAIKLSSLPDGVKKFFDKLTKKEDVTEAIEALSSLKTVLADLPNIFNATRNAIDTTAYDTTIAQLKAQFQATQTFVGLFYSEAEQFDIFTKQLVTQFGAINQAVPTSRDQYRALVESITVVDAATRDQFNGLIALAPAMAQYFDLLSQQADGINEVNEALAAGLETNLFGSYANFASARANVAMGNSPANFIGTNTFTASGNPELLLEIKALKQEQSDTRIVLEAIAQYTYDTAKTQKQWNNDGLPAERVI